MIREKDREYAQNAHRKAPVYPKQLGQCRVLYVHEEGREIRKRLFLMSPATPDANVILFKRIKNTDITIFLVQMFRLLVLACKNRLANRSPKQER